MKMSTGGHRRNLWDTGGHDVRKVRDRATPLLPRVMSARGFDSHDDSQLCDQRRTSMDVSGQWIRHFDLGRMSVDGSGRQKRGLQNRLRGAVKASWVGSIPIHPRQNHCS